MSYIERQQIRKIAILRLNRPEVHHALNRSMLEECRDLLQLISADPTTYVVIITGSGEKAFSAGADLKERQIMSEEEVHKYLSLIRSTFLQVDKLPQPVIAAVNGIAFGGGLELALACDLRVAEEQVKFALPETSLGIIPGAGGTQRLTRIAGLTVAKELIFTARRFSAQEAFQYGIVSKVVQTGQALSEAFHIAEQIAENAPLAIKQAKLAICEGYEKQFAEALEREKSAYDTLIPTKDRMEGLKAFREKRKPIYRGE